MRSVIFPLEQRAIRADTRKVERISKGQAGRYRPRHLRRALLREAFWVRAVALLLIAAIVPVITQPSAFATGSLSAISVTAMKGESGVAGDRDDWNFTPSASATLTRVSMGVKAGTSAPYRYFAGTGLASSEASTPDSTLNSITGDVDLRAAIAPTNWNLGSAQAVIGKWGASGNQESYSLELYAGVLRLLRSHDGIAQISGATDSTTSVPHSGTAPTAVRATATVNNGSGGTDFIFYYKTTTAATAVADTQSNTGWTKLGSTVTETGTTTTFDSTAPVEVGSVSYGQAANLAGKIYYADVRSGIASTAIVNAFNPNDQVLSAPTTWVSTSANGETWTVNRSGTALSASDIGADLSVAAATGVPSGGTAQVRTADAVAVYTFPSATTVSSASTVGLMGFINSNTTGSLTSAVTTYNGTTVVDSGNASALTFSGLNINLGAGTGTSGYTGDGAKATLAKLNGVNSLASDDNGNVYVADESNNVIRKIDQYGIISTLSIGATLTNPSGVYFDYKTSNLWIVDSAKLYRWNTGTSTLTTIGSVTGAQSVVNDGTYSYITTADCRVQKVNVSGTVTTLAGTSASCTTTGDGGAPSSATLAYPQGLAIDSSGRIYVAENGSTTTNGVVRLIDVANNVITTIAGGGSGTTDTVLAVKAQLKTPQGVAVDPTGQVFVGNGGDHNVRRFYPGGTISTVVGASTGGSSGTAGDGGLASSATIGQPYGLTFALGSIWIADNSYNKLRTVADGARVRPYVNNDQFDTTTNQALQLSLLSNDLKIDGEMDPNSVSITVAPTHAIGYSLQANGVVNYIPANNYTGSDSLTYQACDSTLMACNTATVAINVNSNTGVYAVAGGEAEAAALSTAFVPARVTRYRNYLYLTGQYVNVVRRYDIYSKQSVIVAGTGLYPSSQTSNLPAQDARLGRSGAIAVTPAGDIYYADNDRWYVDSITASTGVIAPIAGTGSGSPTADGSPALSTSFGQVSAIAFGNDGTIYVGAASVAVRSFVPGGNVTTVAGALTAGSADGTGGAGGTARFSTIVSIAVNPNNGDLYVADYNNQAIRKISAGNVTTIVNTAHTYGAEVAGPATASPMKSPFAVAVDSANNIYVSDANNYVISKFTDGGSISVIAGGTYGSSADGVVGTSIQMTGSQNLVLGINGDYYYDDGVNAIIRNVSLLSTSGVVKTVFGNGAVTGMSPASGAYAGNAQLGTLRNQAYSAAGIAVDSSNNIFYHGTEQMLVRVDNSTNAATSGSDSIGATSGAGGMAVDGSGNIIVPSPGNGAVLRFNPTTLSYTYMITNSCGCGASMVQPYAVAYDSTKTNLYIVDGSLNEVLKWNGSTLSIIAGNNVAASTGDGGAATAASLNAPRGVAVDNAGNIYIAEQAGRRIRMVDTNGIITTLAGTGSAGVGGDGSQSFTATVNSLYSLSTDIAGNVFIADSGANSVREIDTNNVISKAIGTGVAGGVYNTTPALTQTQGIRGVYVKGSLVYFSDDLAGRVLVAKGVASSASANVLSSAKWSVVPGASGHATTQQQLVVKTNVDQTTSKLTFSVPAGTTGASPTVTESYGVPTTVSASAPSSNLVTLTFGSAFTMKAGVSYAFTISGLSMTSVTNNSYTAGVTLYDNSGTPAQVGWARSSIVSLSSGVPLVTTAGYNSVWAKSSSIKVNSGATVGVSVSPSGVTSASGAIVVQTGSASADNLNGASFNVSSTAATSASPSATISGITANVSTGAALTSTADRWGTGITSISSSGSRAGGLTGSNYVGGTGASQTFVSGSDGANTFTLATGVYVDWLQPAGTYITNFKFNSTGGS